MDWSQGMNTHVHPQTNICVCKLGFLCVVFMSDVQCTHEYLCAFIINCCVLTCICVYVCVCVFVFVCLCERAVLGLVSDSNAPVKRCINALAFFGWLVMSKGTHLFVKCKSTCCTCFCCSCSFLPTTKVSYTSCVLAAPMSKCLRMRPLKLLDGLLHESSQENWLRQAVLGFRKTSCDGVSCIL